MRFDIPAEYAALQAEVTEFIEREVRPLEAGLDPVGGSLPRDLLRRVRRRSAELGFYAASYPRSLGGRDLPQLGMVLLREAVEATGARLAFAVTYHAEGPSPLLLHATPEQQERYLGPLVRAQAVRSMAITEPGGGSDTQALRTTATRVGDDLWLLNGEKHLIGNAEEADFVIVLAVTDAERRARGGMTAFIVDKGTAGLEVVERQHGMAEEPQVYRLRFTDCPVASSQIVGGPGNLGLGHYTAMESLVIGRLTVAGDCNGAAAFALARGVERARARSSFGRPIGAHQYVQGHLVDSLVELQASRLLTCQAAWRYDQGQEVMQEASIAKLYASEMVGRVLDRVIQVHGGEGWLAGPLERLSRRMRAFRFAEGTSEIQKVIIADTLGLPR